MGKAESGHSLPPLLTPNTGSLNLLVRSRSKGALDTHAWSLSGNKGNVWQQAHVPINPSGPFQVSHPGLPLLTALRPGAGSRELRREACRDGGTFLGDRG